MKKLLPLLIILISISCSNNKNNIDLANESFNERNYDFAFLYASKALEEEGDSLQAYSIMGKSRTYGWLSSKTTNQLPEAITYLSNAIEIDSSQSDLYFNRSVAKLLLKDRPGALNDIDKAVELSNDSTRISELYYNKAFIITDSGRNDDAIESYGKSIEFNPDSPFAYRERGDIYHSLNNYENALNDYTKSISLDTNPGTSVLIRRGRIYLELDSLDKACKDFARAVELGDRYSGLQLLDEKCQ